jgi:hypothetical protein
MKARHDTRCRALRINALRINALRMSALRPGVAQMVRAHQEVRRDPMRFAKPTPAGANHGRAHPGSGCPGSRPSRPAPLGLHRLALFERVQTNATPAPPARPTPFKSTLDRPFERVQTASQQRAFLPTQHPGGTPMHPPK